MNSEFKPAAELRLTLGYWTIVICGWFGVRGLLLDPSRLRADLANMSGVSQEITSPFVLAIACVGIALAIGRYVLTDKDAPE